MEDQREATEQVSVEDIPGDTTECQLQGGGKERTEGWSWSPMQRLRVQTGGHAWSWSPFQAGTSSQREWSWSPITNSQHQYYGRWSWSPSQLKILPYANQDEADVRPTQRQPPVTAVNCWPVFIDTYQPKRKRNRKRRKPMRDRPYNYKKERNWNTLSCVTESTHGVEKTTSLSPEDGIKRSGVSHNTKHQDSYSCATKTRLSTSHTQKTTNIWSQRENDSSYLMSIGDKVKTRSASPVPKLKAEPNIKFNSQKNNEKSSKNSTPASETIKIKEYLTKWRPNVFEKEKNNDEISSIFQLDHEEKLTNVPLCVFEHGELDELQIPINEAVSKTTTKRKMLLKSSLPVSENDQESNVERKSSSVHNVASEIDEVNNTFRSSSSQSKFDEIDSSTVQVNISSLPHDDDDEMIEIHEKSSCHKLNSASNETTEAHNQTSMSKLKTRESEMEVLGKNEPSLHEMKEGNELQTQSLPPAYEVTQAQEKSSSVTERTKVLATKTDVNNDKKELPLANNGAAGEESQSLSLASPLKTSRELWKSRSPSPVDKLISGGLRHSLSFEVLDTPRGISMNTESVGVGKHVRSFSTSLSDDLSPQQSTLMLPKDQVLYNKSYLGNLSSPMDCVNLKHKTSLFYEEYSTTSSSECPSMNQDSGILSVIDKDIILGSTNVKSFQAENGKDAIVHCENENKLRHCENENESKHSFINDTLQKDMSSIRVSADNKEERNEIQNVVSVCKGPCVPQGTLTRIRTLTLPCTATDIKHSRVPVCDTNSVTPVYERFEYKKSQECNSPVFEELELVSKKSSTSSVNNEKNTSALEKDPPLQTKYKDTDQVKPYQNTLANRNEGRNLELDTSEVTAFLPSMASYLDSVAVSTQTARLSLTSQKKNKHSTIKIVSVEQHISSPIKGFSLKSRIPSPAEGPSLHGSGSPSPAEGPSPGSRSPYLERPSSHGSRSPSADEHSPHELRSPSAAEEPSPHGSINQFAKEPSTHRSKSLFFVEEPSPHELRNPSSSQEPSPQESRSPSSAKKLSLHELRSSSPAERPSPYRSRNPSARRHFPHGSRSVSSAEEPMSQESRCPSPADEPLSKESSSLSPGEESLSQISRNPSPVEKSLPQDSRNPSPAEESLSQESRSPSPAEEFLPQESRSPSPAEEFLPQESRSPSPAEEFLPQESRSPSPAEEFLPQESRSPSPAEESLPQESRSSSLAEESLHQELSSLSHDDKLLHQKSRSPSPAEESLPQESRSPSTAEESLPQESRTPSPAEESLPQESRSPSPAEKPLLRELRNLSIAKGPSFQGMKSPFPLKEPSLHGSKSPSPANQLLLRGSISLSTAKVLVSQGSKSPYPVQEFSLTASNNLSPADKPSLKGSGTPRLPGSYSRQAVEEGVSVLRTTGEAHDVWYKGSSRRYLPHNEKTQAQSSQSETVNIRVRVDHLVKPYSDEIDGVQELTTTVLPSAVKRKHSACFAGEGTIDCYLRWKKLATDPKETLNAILKKIGVGSIPRTSTSQTVKCHKSVVTRAVTRRLASRSPNHDLHHVAGARMEIFNAVESGDFEKVRELMQDTGPAVRQRDTHCTLLHAAVNHRQVDMVLFFLKFISPNVVNKEGSTPAHLAAGKGHTQILRLLLADPEMDPNKRDHYNNTYKHWLTLPLLEAVVEDSRARGQELLRLGADPDHSAEPPTDGLEGRTMQITTGRQLAHTLHRHNILPMFERKCVDDCKSLSDDAVGTALQVLMFPEKTNGMDKETKLVVDTSTRMVRGSDVYRMDAASRGYVCILSYGSFHDRTDLHLEGSQTDAHNLANVFSKMGYTGHAHFSLTADQTRQQLAIVRDMKLLEQAGCAVFIISSHGEPRRHFLTSDMQTINIQWVLDFFKDSQCPSLKNKPKLFIWDLCRGHQEEKGSRKKTHKELCGRVDEPLRDVMCLDSSSGGFTWHAFSEEGTPFIGTLCSVLARDAATKELTELYREFLKEYATAAPDAVPQLTNYGFNKKFYFHPTKTSSDI